MNWFNNENNVLESYLGTHCIGERTGEPGWEQKMPLQKFSLATSYGAEPSQKEWTLSFFLPLPP
jgi:hypothetical protein